VIPRKAFNAQRPDRACQSQSHKIPPSALPKPTVWETFAQRKFAKAGSRVTITENALSTQSYNTKSPTNSPKHRTRSDNAKPPSTRPEEDWAELAEKAEG